MYELVHRIRAAIEEAHMNGEFRNVIYFSDFPSGCCGLASDLIGHYLLELGIESEYVCGSYSKGDYDNIITHAWVRMADDIIIDITGEQFKFMNEFSRYDKPVWSYVKI